jgi:dipeptidyl aminopeptidase/acylaminoacyl peptidase
MDRRLFLQTAVTLAAAPGATLADEPPPAAPPLEDFFRHDNYSGLSLSPDGRTLAAVIPVGSRRNVAVIDLASRQAQALTAIQDRDVLAVRWISDRRLVYDLIDLQSGLGEQRPSGLFAVNKDGSDFKELISPNINAKDSVTFVYRPSGFLSSVPGSEDVLITARERSVESADVYRVDSRTGRRTLLTFSNPGRVLRWLVDTNRAPRIAVSAIDRTTRAAVYYRPDANAEWVKLTEFDTLESGGFDPLSFGPDGTLYVASFAGNDHAAIYTYDLKQNKLGERLVAHKDFDFGYGNGARHLVFDKRTKKLVGIRLDAEREEFYWLDEDWAKRLATVDSGLRGRVNRLVLSEDETSNLVFSYSDKDPGRWYLFDPAKRTLEELASRRPAINPAQQGERRFVRYPARDGLPIPAYLTLPPKRAEKDLPLVVLVHGGPFLRGEYWYWDPEAQFLASRGYAVLQPDYRGSQGYGWKHYRAGWRQWGLAMQDDLTDGVKWLIGRGIVDARRVAIMGGSYGGYATTMGLAKDPELYRCGIDIAGVTDLILMGNATWSDMPVDRPEFQKWFAAHVGDLGTEREQLRAHSPSFLAKSIRRPVLIAHGADDIRVPIEHASRMRAALSDAGVPVEWVVYDDEAHGFLREANRFDLYNRIERFLLKNMV